MWVVDEGEGEGEGVGDCQLNTGDEFYLMEDKKLVCKADYEAAKARGGLWCCGVVGCG